MFVPGLAAFSVQRAVPMPVPRVSVGVPSVSPLPALRSSRLRHSSTALAALGYAIGALGLAFIPQRGSQRLRAEKCRRRHNSFNTLAMEETVRPEGEKGDPWGPQFDWRRAWYPMALVEENLDTKRLNKMELLGEDLVAWVDGTGQWRVFEDHCPHRCVPLSEGRLETDGTLMCSYHGWRFAGDGKVTDIPQAKQEDVQRLLKNRRACASVRPALVKEGILWVWGESSPDAFLQSALVEPNLPEELYDPEMKGRVSEYWYPWGMRDVPYGWDVALENVMDPAHVAVAHHNTLANRYLDPCPVEMRFVRRGTNIGGFKFQFRSLWKTPERFEEEMVSTMEFRPPSYHRVTTELPNGACLTVVNNFVPTKPGRARQISSKLLLTGKNGEKAPLNALGYKVKEGWLPNWLRHILQPLFVHQDLVFVHHQQVILQKHFRKAGNTWKQSFWMPCEADKSTVALRTWIDRNGGIGWSPGVSTEVHAVSDPQLLFDTYSAHTTKCATCSKALRRISRAQKGLSYSALALAFVGVSHVSILPLSGAAFLALASKCLSKIKSLFYTYPFNHQDNA